MSVAPHGIFVLFFVIIILDKEKFKFECHSYHISETVMQYRGKSIMLLEIGKNHTKVRTGDGAIIRIPTGAIDDLTFENGDAVYVEDESG